ncbi:nucleotidyltransferase family protein [Chamaesiphon sp.]|uniref:nucleotidyltransferase domain-containing protein n=1 Tax=Chamaesiphon sp. TaxID=2814140 RepID=UPI0035946EC5
MTLTSLTIPDRIARSSDRQSEIELLLCCSHTHPDPHQLSRISELVTQQLDWAYILERATHHNILPLIDRQLELLDAHQIPSAVTTQIHTNFQENFQRNLYLTAELVKLGRLFATHQIPLLSFKGPILAQIAYGNLGLRQFLDLDILVPEADVVRASELLVSLGYQPQFDLTASQQVVYAGLRNEHCFWHEEKQVCVDLHWSILPSHFSFTPDPQLLWQKSERVEFGAQSIATLTPAHLLLFLCAHGAKHNWWRLYWICDLAELLRTHPDLDWDNIHRLSGRFGTTRMLLLGLYLAQQLLGTVLPTSICTAIAADATIPILATQIQERLFQSPEGDEPEIDPDANWTWRDYAIYRGTIPSLRDRVWYWVDTILTPTPLEWELVTLPRSLFPLYYLIRAMRLSLKYLFRFDNV